MSGKAVEFADNGLVGIFNLLKANEVSQVKVMLNPPAGATAGAISLIGINQTSTTAIHVSWPTKPSKFNSASFSLGVDTMHSKIAKIKDKWDMTYNQEDGTVTMKTQNLGGTLITTETTIEDIAFPEEEINTRLEEARKMVAEFHSNVLCEALKLPIVGKSSDLIYKLQLTATHLNLTTYSEYNRASCNRFALPRDADSPNSGDFECTFKAVQIEKILGFGSTFDRCLIGRGSGDMVVFRFSQARNPVAVATIWLTETIDA